ncbi:MAG: hypothetical protein CVU89_15140 [Firmicutes bacterium HGW-Firmicutes-14]|nr:MAG: hypothetical protein CVU89_15140 [Firmicutes bacterium HGW-Firmicutes-14]
MFGIKLAGFALSSFIVTLFILPKIKNMLIEAGFVRPNFRREEIPMGVGLVFFLSVLVVTAAGRGLGFMDERAYAFLFAVGAMGFLGLIDDVFGTRHASGLKGHFKKLIFERELTTGALKALAGGIIALALSVGMAEGTGVSKWASILLNALIMAFSTNAINLLDLRPGRAAKGFLLAAAFIIAAGAGTPELLYLAVVAGSLLAYLPLDLKATAMMGDTGSNMLGMTVGFTAAFVLPAPLKTGYFIFLILFHLLTEKYSLTGIIEKNRVLTYIDMIGRK